MGEDDMKDPELLTEMPPVLSDELFDDVIGGYLDGFRRFAALRAAVDISLFAHTRGPVTIATLADDMDCDPVMLRMLCDCLVSMGHLLVKDGLYVSSEATALYLDPGSPRYQGTVLSNMSRRAEDWMDLSALVREGPRIDGSGEVYGEGWIKAIAESSMGGGVASVVSTVLDTVELPSEGTFMDLGGGHGLYTVAFSRKCPGLRCSLFDTPGMTAVARRVFDEYGCDAETVDGDFYVDDLGGPYDVLFSSFNHSTSDSGMCGKVFSAVKPGGLLILRRHLRRGDTDPLRVLEWNLRVRDPGEKGKVRFGGSWLPTSEEYIGTMLGLGMSMVSRRDLEDGSELVVMRRRNGDQPQNYAESA